MSVDSSSLTLRDFVAPIGRHRMAIAATFLAVLGASAAVAMLTPPEYVSQMTLLVRRERADPIVSGEQETQTARGDVSESELLSEVEMLTSRELLERVAINTGLHTPKSFSDAREEARARAGAVQRLRNRLSVTPIRRTTIIRVRYTARDPQMAARVLDELSQRYLDKHLAVHRALDSQEFFGEQVARSHEELMDAQARLTEFSRRERVVAPEQERTAVLQQLSTFEALLQQARAEEADAERRLAAVQNQLGLTPGRQVTAVRTANGPMLAQLHQRVLEMELQRDELLRKFTPQYPAVVQLEAQLTHTRDTLALAEMAPIMDETTDQNPTHQWLRNEDARLRAERSALGARVVSIQRSVAQYQERARRLNDQTVGQMELLRDLKAAEEATLLYERKEEEARISDALDRMRIANVKVADPPTAPVSPSGGAQSMILLIGFAASVLLSLGVAYTLDWLNPVMYTASDVQSALDLPVLAAIRGSADRYPA